MLALIVFESMYGNTRLIAEHVGEGLHPVFGVSVVSVNEASPALVSSAELLVVGGPTHIHGLSSNASRKMARDAADKQENALVLDPAATAPGLRDWLEDMPRRKGRAAAFDTRVGGSAVLTGRASKGIAKRLQGRGYRLVLPAESFLVDKENHLIEGELERARAWGAALARQASVQAAS